MRKRMKRLWMILLAVCMLLGVGERTYASRLSDLKEKNEEDKNKLEELDGQIGDMEDEAQGIQSEMQEVELALVDIMASISLLEDEIAEKKEEIIEVTAELEQAKIDEEKQYEEMINRIHYNYENGQLSYVDILLSATSISDILNRADYLDRLYEYDRNLLEKYHNARLLVEELKEQLEIEEAELETAQAECEEEQAGLEVALAELEQLNEDYEIQIAKARQEAQVYKTLIKQQNAEIKRLEEEERRKAEEAARLAAMRNKPVGKATVNKEEILAVNGSAKGKEIAIYACGFVGNPYVWGGTSLTNGADCSGFTQSVYKAYGYKIPRTSYQQRSAGKAVSYAEAQPGDLICYAGHVAMYIGNGKIVHASSRKTGIIIGYATYKPIICVRRIV